MPATDFAPGNAAAVDPSKVYLIKGTTLKKLLVEVICDPAQFDVKITPNERIYTYREPGASSTYAAGDGWWGNVLVTWQPASASGPEEYVTLNLTIEAGRITAVTYGLDGGTAVYGTSSSPGSAELVIQQ